MDKINRRRFIGATGLIGLGSLCALPAVATDTTPHHREDQLLKTAPYLQALLPYGVVIRWITTSPSYSWIEFGEKQHELANEQHTIDAGLVEANNMIHAIKLKGLLPNTTYYYRACSKTINITDPYKIKYGEVVYSAVYSFTTPSRESKSVSFLVFNDIHDRPASFDHLLKLAGNEQRDFVFLNGDMFDYQIDENQLVNHLFNPLATLTSSGTPFIFSRGNHETRGQFARQIGQYFNGYSNQFYFSFQYGPIYFIVLDSGEDKEDSDFTYAGLADFDAYRIEQAHWLKEEVQKKAFKKAKYKVVFSHIPLFYTKSPWRYGVDHCRKVWGSILNEANIDVLICGHTHTYGVHPPVIDEHQYPIVIGGGPGAGKRTIIKVKADNQSLELEMLDDTGNVVGALSI